MENENNTNRLFIWVAILLILIVVGSVFYFLERSDISGKVTEEKLSEKQSEVMLQGENVNDPISGTITNSIAVGFVEKYLSASSLEVPVYWYFDRAHVEDLFTVHSSGNAVSHIRFYSAVDNTIPNNAKLTFIVVPIYQNIGFDRTKAMYEFAITCPARCPKVLPEARQIYTSMDKNDVPRSFEFSKSEVQNCFVEGDNVLRVGASIVSGGKLKIALCGINVKDANFEEQVVYHCSSVAPTTLAIGEAHTIGNDFPNQ